MVAATQNVNNNQISSYCDFLDQTSIFADCAANFFGGFDIKNAFIGMGVSKITSLFYNYLCLGLDPEQAFMYSFSVADLMRVGLWSSRTVVSKVIDDKFRENPQIAIDLDVPNRLKL